MVKCRDLDLQKQILHIVVVVTSLVMEQKNCTGMLVLMVKMVDICEGMVVLMVESCKGFVGVVLMVKMQENW